jgi:hypothetical protein
MSSLMSRSGVFLPRRSQKMAPALNTTTGDEMSQLKVIAIASELAEKVRESRVSPGYGHPVTAKVATGHGPCRHCLRPFAVGQDVRLLFTLNPFEGVAPIPQPGPVFIHQETCERYVEAKGYPSELLRFGAVLDGYDRDQLVRRRETVTDGSQETAIEKMMQDQLVRYVMVRDGSAGCYGFRVERRKEC